MIHPLIAALIVFFAGFCFGVGWGDYVLRGCDWIKELMIRIVLRIILNRYAVKDLSFETKKMMLTYLNEEFTTKFFNSNDDEIDYDQYHKLDEGQRAWTYLDQQLKTTKKQLLNKAVLYYCGEKQK